MLSLNWIDYLILAILIFYAYEGYARGFIGALLDLINFVLAFVAGLKLYGFFAGILVSSFSMPQGFSNAIGFFIATFLTEIIIVILIRKYFVFKPPVLKRLNRWFGIAPGVLSGAILISFILMLAVAFPVSAPIKQAISQSKVSSLLLAKAQGLEKNLNRVFGGAINETINFLTIGPRSSELISLNFTTKDFSPDPASELYMFELINKERAKRGLKELVFDDDLADVGINHCKDMLERGYFSHYTVPEGFSPFNRMEEEGIIYSYAGENLALSANTDIAMLGLMESPGHKANILSPDFGRVGIGVIDAGIYGEIFCQEFTD